MRYLMTSQAYTSFRFKHFRLVHGDDVWKVGTDSVLLGSWADPGDSLRILDMGTGSGILALMLAQRYQDLHIDAADTVPRALEVAAGNVRKSKWRERIAIWSQDLTEINEDWIDRYDAVVCNPPYFPSGLSSLAESRRSSRQGIGFSLWDVPLLARRYIKSEGRLYVVIPSTMVYAFIERTNAQGFYVQRRLDVRHKKDTSVSLALLNFTQKRVKPVQKDLTLYDTNNKPTLDYMQLCEDYLSF